MSNIQRTFTLPGENSQLQAVVELSRIYTVEYRQFWECSFTLEGEELFHTKEFSTPIGRTDIAAVYDYLGFITLSPGDTDQDYFSDYTELQHGWASSYACGELQAIIYDNG